MTALPEGTTNSHRIGLCTKIDEREGRKEGRKEGLSGQLVNAIHTRSLARVFHPEFIFATVSALDPSVSTSTSREMRDGRHGTLKRKGSEW